jgi:hypothetical protein
MLQKIFQHLFPVGLMLVLAGVPVLAQTTAFTYQGKLADGGSPATGNYDFEFKLYSASIIGGLLGTQTKLAVPVSGGGFTVQLDFGTQFDGTARFLEIGVKPAGSSGAYTVLAPRQPITSVPYSVRSLATGDADKLGGVAANQFVQTNDSRLTDDRNPLPGSSNYIRNGIAGQIANFHINGNGYIDGNLNVGGTLIANLPAGDTSYVQNRTTQQASTNFSISGNGTAMQFNAPTFVGTDYYGTNFTGNNFSAFNNFRINGSRVLAAPDMRNTFAGLQTGTVNTGADNAFFGFNAGNANTTGSDNSFFGSDAGGNNINGANNAFFGSDTGDANTSGSDNSFFGRSAGHSNTTGNSNTFLGKAAGTNNTTASNNTFIGEAAGRDNTTGYSNTFVGEAAGVNTTTGHSNSFLGNGAGSGNSTGQFNTAIGDNARFASGNLSYATAIGAGAVASVSNSIVLGRSTEIDAVFIHGPVLIDGSLTVHYLYGGGITQLCLTASDVLASCSSSLRYKTNVKAFLGGLDVVRRLRPITFDWKDGGTHDIGFGAEEVNEIDPLLTTRNKQGEIEGVKYNQLTTVLVNAVKEQQAQIEAQQKEIAALKKLICLDHPEAEMCKP